MTVMCSTPVASVQTQIGNWTDPNKFGTGNPLAEDVPKDLAFATEALGQESDAVNLWIGMSAAVTAVHKDPYENFVPAVSTGAWLMKEKMLQSGRYVPVNDDDLTAFRVDLDGMKLYLPTLWFHLVEQYQNPTHDVNPYVVAVNWWYDMEYGSMFAHINLVR
ncbi:hypothetical protein AMAG_05735 [Allomyces macrogynus ATCC 38327]|uniref:Cupin-like domain-containing protein n=1 Tax=Allomyces macrogynus (strain ATCC 38327) TaxID=578462 RepID=A0A0L0SCR6_ALLM3|nr:hypothetical protein AMAG_05735 [Allomyces macrogynus ATCC 38327]|eukprot:KNE60338.1 hypothetical protein AMAG_05735 [Allomyces macrogynus ATCC 38327]